MVNRSSGFPRDNFNPTLVLLRNIFATSARIPNDKYNTPDLILNRDCLVPLKVFANNGSEIIGFGGPAIVGGQREDSKREKEQNQKSEHNQYREDES